ncbi:hypothetical protein A2841_03890 [Candidatus Kaiserbacteria bacterium RIFCSPHIGHO2_01_FULL_48_10]|uniref:D-alanyl-D-alanine dipeptidase n=1 Tax=Candidatus Kaiserbacteria bacterium RIFCSPHIGHO2_01_FULL_48_10 TaxID=1798476 RepID=A0A1F6C2I7_9BACT|nr:MAG: hypothetical protein A2841_03890 [Candidatus Kaiserbacteria bacterium RIFCSPHIGHO2_01_FULL_48_10]
MSEPIPIRDNGEPLVDLGGYDFVLEPMYFKRGFSPIQKMYLRKGVAEKLSTIQKTLGGLRFKIWDAWRPREVQAKLYRQHWNTLRKKEPDWTDVEIKEEVETYVASPDLPLPAHLSGGAIDLTLVDTTGRELDMGTPFDHFALEASPHFFETSVRNPGFAHIEKNRKLILTTMAAADFRVYPSEWWHFDYGTERWARELGKPHALYGEISLPT